MSRFRNVNRSGPLVGGSSTILQRKKCALLSAMADLDDEDLEEVALYARFRRAQQRKRRRDDLAAAPWLLRHHNQERRLSSRILRWLVASLVTTCGRNCHEF